MSELLFPNSKKMDGPWLVDHDQLMRLDSILDSAWDSLIEHRNIRIDEVCNSRINEKEDEYQESRRDDIVKEIQESYEFRNISKTVKTLFKSGKSLSSSSISEAMSNRSIQDEVVETLEVKLNCGEVDLGLTIGDYSKNLTVTVRPMSCQVTDGLFISLDRWACNVRPKKWLRLWKEWSGFHWFIVGIIILLSTSLISDSNDLYKKHLRSEAHELIKNGITQNNSIEAINILLALETKYVPDKWVENSSRTINLYLLFIASMLVLSIALSYPPVSHIGITRQSVDKIKRWRTWIKTISITIPGIILSGILLPFAYDNIKVLLQ